MADVPTITLNTDALDKKRTAALDAKLDGKIIFVPRRLLLELFNSTNAHEYAFDNIARLYNHKERVYVAPDLGTYIMHEREDGQSVRDPLYSIGDTPRFRQLISDSYKAPGATKRDYISRDLFDSVTADMDELKDEVGQAAPVFDEWVGQLKGDNSVTAEKLVACYNDFRLIPETFCRKGRADMVEISELIMSRIPAIKPEYIKPLANGNGSFPRMLIGRFVYACKATGSDINNQRSAQSGRNPRFLLSEHNDNDIAIVGSFTDELLVHDEGHQWADAAIRYAVKMLLP